MVENQYILSTSLSHRKEFAQFFTPEIVARLMAKWILRNSPAKVLDPAFGLGIFYREIRKLDANVKCVGYEVDDFILSNIDVSLLHDPMLSIEHMDYLVSELVFYDAIICNPPYLRFQKFKNRLDILPKLQEQIGVDILGYANIASVFLFKSLYQLRPGGRLAYIMPYEFLNAGYGKKLKQILLDENFLQRIVIFENEKEIFPEAITTVCVLLCEKGNAASTINVSFVTSQKEVESIDSFDELPTFSIDKRTLDHAKKWSPIFENLHTEVVIPAGFCKLSEFGGFKRGIATGGNEFFTLSKGTISKWQIPEDMVTLCITKSMQVKSSIFTKKELSALIEDDAYIYLLDAKEPLDEHTKAYLSYGESLDIHKRYLTKIRKPWYKIENRTPSPLLFGVFSRNRYKIIRNYTDCLNLTCYHSFYPNMFGFNYVDRLFLYFLSDLGNTILKSNQRKYGDGLMKFEPNDLNDSYVPSSDLLNRLNANEVDEAIMNIEQYPDSGIEFANEIMKRLSTTQ
jgi:adenine-specific DNA-methyltransferase